MIRVFSRYTSPKALVLIVLEGCLITLALLSAVRIRFWSDVEEFSTFISLPGFATQVLVFVGTILVCSYYCQLYSPTALRSRNEQLIASGQALGSGCMLLGIVYFVFPALLLGRGIFFISLTLTPAVVTISRIVLDRVWKASIRENIIILGTDKLACVVANELSKRSDLSADLIGMVQSEREAQPYAELGRRILGPAKDLLSIVEQHKIGCIIVALEDRRNVLPIRELVRLRVQGVRVEDAHSALSSLTGRVWLETVKPSWFVFTDGFHRSSVTLILKRALDLSYAIVGLALSLPLMLLVAVAIRLDSKGPIFYRQQRVGVQGKCFDLIKFRSMRNDAEKDSGPLWAKNNDPRTTRVGKYLRKYRLDELPQFLNVIRGDMSFVGPRPERPEFVETLRKQIPYYDERHTIRPGVTGWAQVQYQYGSSVEDAFRKLEYDLFYMKSMSVFFDCSIIIDTIGIVLSGRGS